MLYRLGENVLCRKPRRWHQRRLIALASTHVFDRDQLPQHPETPSHKTKHLNRHQLATELGFQQVKPGQRDGKAIQLNFIVSVSQRTGLELRKLKITLMQMRPPQQLGPALFHEVKRTASDKQHQLILMETHPRDEVVQIGKRAVGLTLSHETLHKMLLDALQEHESHINGLAFERGEVFAVIDTGQMHLGTHAPRFVEIEPWPIKPSEVVDHRLITDT